jgi:hypothetical protein
VLVTIAARNRAKNKCSVKLIYTRKGGLGARTGRNYKGDDRPKGMYIRKHQSSRPSPNDQNTPNISRLSFLRAIDCLHFGIHNGRRHVRPLFHFEAIGLHLPFHVDTQLFTASLAPENRCLRGTSRFLESDTGQVEKERDAVEGKQCRDYGVVYRSWNKALRMQENERFCFLTFGSLIWLHAAY